MLKQIKQKNLNWQFFQNEMENVWPIRWQIFRPNKNLLKAVLDANYYLQFGFILFLVGFLVSFYFLGLSGFLVISKEVPDKGGIFYEGFLGAELTHVNPVLDSNSDLENKVIDLLYEPLYRTILPDFARNSQIKIEPVLVSREPIWQDLNNPNPEERYKILRFSLKPDLKWSDGTSLGLKDIRYTFERLKEPNGNNQFRDSLANVEFVSISNTDFDLRSSVSNPQLIYNANFAPISESYFSSFKNDQIQTSRNMAGAVTSGAFLLKPNYNEGGKTKPNPTILANSRFDQIILEKNSKSNGRISYLDQFVLQNYDSLADTGGSNKSLEKANENSNLDIFSRFLSGSNAENSDQIKQKIKLEQKIIPTNIYYSIFLNIKKSSNGYFINQNLRRYLICSLFNWQNDKLSTVLSPLPKNKQTLPIQMQGEALPECGENQQKVEENLKNAKGSDGQKIYSLSKDKQVLIYGKPFEPGLTLLTTLDNNNSILKETSEFLKSIGLPVKIINEPSETRKNLENNNRDINLVLLPMNITNNDPYSIFGLKAKNLIQAVANDRVKDYNFEENLKKYSQSNFGDNSARKGLTDFFGKEFVMFNLGRGLQEINYSKRIKNLDFDEISVYNFGSDLYFKLPKWYWQTKRVL